MSVDEPVHIAEYNPAWPALFVLERDRIRTALDVAFEQLEHIGSTAVPGLAGKPIIDIMLGLTAWPPDECFIKALCGQNYQSFGEAGVPGRLYCRLRGSTSFNLHVVHFGGHHWIANLSLREYLRRDQTARDRYAVAKRLAIASDAVTLVAYSQAKAQTISALLEEALALPTGSERSSSQ